MPVEGFDDASKNIKASGVRRRKQVRDANKAKTRKIRDAADEAKAQKIKTQKETNAKNEADFSRYASKYEQSRLDANRTFRAGGSKRKFIEGVVAKGKKKELDYFAGESDKAVKRDADKKAAKAKADGNITKTVTPKTKAKVVAPKAKPASTKTTTTKPPAETKLVNAPGAYTKPSEFKKSASTFTSAADRLRAKGVSNLKPTPSKTKKGSYNFSEGTGPNTSVFDKTKNVAPKTEEKAYQKKGTMGKGKATKINAKPKKRAAKGSRAATLKKGFGY